MCRVGDLAGGSRKGLVYVKDGWIYDGILNFLEDTTNSHMAYSPHRTKFPYPVFHVASINAGAMNRFLNGWSLYYRVGDRQSPAIVLIFTLVRETPNTAVVVFNLIRQPKFFKNQKSAK